MSFYHTDKREEDGESLLHQTGHTRFYRHFRVTLHFSKGRFLVTITGSDHERTAESLLPVELLKFLDGLLRNDFFVKL